MVTPLATSASTLVRRKPSRSTIPPPKNVASTVGANVSAATTPVSVALPVVSRTYHGIATNPIAFPLSESASATSSATSGRRGPGAARSSDVPSIVMRYARTILMSPDIAVAFSSTSGPSPSSSPESSSERASPVTVLTSIQTREPRRTPTSMSPETDLSSTLPSRDCADANVARHAVHRQGGADLFEADVAGRGLDLRLAADGSDREVARGGLQLHGAADALDLHVAARDLDLGIALDLADGDVAGGGLHLDGAVAAVRR